MSDVLDPTRDELIDRAMTLLVAAAYGNPIVRRAVDQVEAEIRQLRSERDARAGLIECHVCGSATGYDAS